MVIGDALVILVGGQINYAPSQCDEDGMHDDDEDAGHGEDAWYDGDEDAWYDDEEDAGYDDDEDAGYDDVTVKESNWQN